MPIYSFTGDVAHFRTVVATDVRMMTQAPTPQRAKANFEFRMKKQLGLVKSTEIHLLGNIQEVRPDYEIKEKVVPDESYNQLSLEGV